MEEALPLVEGAIGEAFESLLGCIGLTAAVARPLRLRSSYGRDAADKVLQATDLENLYDRLSALGGDQELWHNEAPSSPDETGSVGRAWERLHAEVEATTLDMASLVAVLGRTAAQRCESGSRAIKLAVRRLEQYRRRIEEMSPGTFPASGESASRQKITALVSDLRLGATIRQAVGAALRTAAACCVIARAEELGTKLEPWLALGLADAWAEGPERLASALGDPETMLAWLAKAISDLRKAERTKASLQQWEQAAVSSGEKVYFPIDGGVDRF